MFWQYGEILIPRNINLIAFSLINGQKINKIAHTCTNREQGKSFPCLLTCTFVLTYLRGNLISKKNCLACKSSLFGKLAVAASMSSA